MKADFEIENLVYIIVLLIIAITSIFGKKKKPVQKVQSDVTAQETGNPIFAEDALEKKLKEFFGDYSQAAPAAPPEQSIEEEYLAGEKLDTPVSTEQEYASDKVFSAESKLDVIKSPFEKAEEIVDTIGTEEGISNWNYAEEVQITDEIKLSEGKEPESVDYNPEIEELLANFNARQGFIYSEIFDRKQF